MNPDTILERGKKIGACANMEALAFFPENKKLVKDLLARYRAEWVVGKDGQALNQKDKEWIVVGSKGQLFEYGAKKLGISAEGRVWSGKALLAFDNQVIKAQIGDGEVQFCIPWTADNVARAAKLFKLKRAPISRNRQINSPED